MVTFPITLADTTDSHGLAVLVVSNNALQPNSTGGDFQIQQCCVLFALALASRNEKLARVSLRKFRNGSARLQSLDYEAEAREV